MRAAASSVSSRGTGDGWYFADFSPVWLDRVWQGHEASAISYLFGAAAATVAWACVWPSLANLALLCGGGGGRPGTRLLTTCFGAVIAISVLDLTAVLTLTPMLTLALAPTLTPILTLTRCSTSRSGRRWRR